MEVAPHIVDAPPTGRPQDTLTVAEARLGHALQEQHRADRVVELAELNIARHGGPAYCSPGLVSRLMRAWERALVCELEVGVCNQRAVSALVGAHEQDEKGRTT